MIQPADDGPRQFYANNDIELADDGRVRTQWCHTPGRADNFGGSERPSFAGLPEPLPVVELADVDHGSQKLATAGHRHPRGNPREDTRRWKQSRPLAASRQRRQQGSTSYGSRQRRASLNSRRDSDGAKRPALLTKPRCSPRRSPSRRDENLQGTRSPDSNGSTANFNPRKTFCYRSGVIPKRFGWNGRAVPARGVRSSIPARSTRG